MSTMSRRRSRVKPARSIRLLSAPAAGRPGLLRITVGGEVFTYRIAVIPADFGAGFELTKLLPGGRDGESYAVNLAGSCERKGFLSHGHCKHLDGLRKLVAEGLLTASSAS
jgi:hypothetical protein